MTNKELRKLSRKDLLEMLLAQTKELSQVQKQLNEANRKLNEADRKLEERKIAIENSGSIAEAALKLNNVFEVAQTAADHYLENIAQLQSEAQKNAEAKARAIIASAEMERKALLKKTEQECAAMISEAKEECEFMRYTAAFQTEKD